MAGEQESGIGRQALPSPAGRWWRIVAGFVALLALSEALWLWQTWPVRDLLEPPARGTPVASTR